MQRVTFPRAPQSPQGRDFSESAALVIADDIAADISGGEPPAPYEASGVCYAEFGDGLVSKVDVNFLRGEAPSAQRHDPSREYAAEKAESARRAVRAGSGADVAGDPLSQ